MAVVGRYSPMRLLSRGVARPCSSSSTSTSNENGKLFVDPTKPVAITTKPYENTRHASTTLRFSDVTGWKQRRAKPAGNFQALHGNYTNHCLVKRALPALGWLVLCAVFSVFLFIFDMLAESTSKEIGRE